MLHNTPQALPNASSLSNQFSCPGHVPLINNVSKIPLKLYLTRLLCLTSSPLLVMSHQSFSPLQRKARGVISEAHWILRHSVYDH